MQWRPRAPLARLFTAPPKVGIYTHTRVNTRHTPTQSFARSELFAAPLLASLYGSNAAPMSDDESLAATVREHFELFLTTFSSDADVAPNSNLDEAPREYIEQVREMTLDGPEESCVPPQQLLRPAVAVMPRRQRAHLRGLLWKPPGVSAQPYGASAAVATAVAGGE